MSYTDEPICPKCDLSISDCICHFPPEIDWHSRAIAAEQERDKALALVASYDRQDELIGTEFEGVDEVTEVIRLLKEERDQLKAELQQAREAVEWIVCYKERLMRWCGIHSDPIGTRLRATLERIEKEKTSPG